MRRLVGSMLAAVSVIGASAGSRAQAPASVTPSAPCESLAKLPLTNGRVTSAEATAAGFTSPAGPGGRGGRGGGGQPPAQLPPFCRVAATLTPTPQSDIRIEVWLPQQWNERLIAVGNGGWAGSISYGAMATALAAGYATVSTDTGHTGPTPSFAIERPEAVADYAYRSEHEMTVTARKLIAALYGRAPQFSYWDGCSTGGKQALTEAQRYPDDFNGIVAGAPANYMIHLHAAQTTIAQAVDRPGGRIPAEKFPMIQAAALAACDAQDGLKDGLIDDPRRCAFDPATLACKADDAPTCLTPAQVETVRTIYGPIVHPKTGAEIFPGLMRGSEALWGSSVAQPLPFPMQTFQYVIFRNPSWDYHSFSLATDVDIADRMEEGRINNAIDPNLAPFFDRGGKLLIYHGWSDHHISPVNSINYYTSVVRSVGEAKAARSIRLFMAPGMAHCGGGDGPNAFDRIGAIRAWVENGTAPERIVASKTTDGQVVRTRPLCPHPQVARWTGSGSSDDAANFSCANPR